MFHVSPVMCYFFSSFKSVELIGGRSNLSSFFDGGWILEGSLFYNHNQCYKSCHKMSYLTKIIFLKDHSKLIFYELASLRRCLLLIKEVFHYLLFVFFLVCSSGYEKSYGQPKSLQTSDNPKGSHKKITIESMIMIIPCRAPPPLFWKLWSP